MPPESTGTPAPKSAVALLIVHGIGEQKAGDTANKLVSGLSKAYGDRLHVDRDANGLPLRLLLGDRVVNLYEVYWAEILSGARVIGTFRWDTICALGWFPWLNWKRGLLGAPAYSRGLVFAWSLFLIPATLSLYLLYFGARFLALATLRFKKGKSPPGGHVEGQGRWARFRARVSTQAARGREERTIVEEMLDTVAGDVTNYMFSLTESPQAGEQSPLSGAGVEILNCFYRALAKALDDECSEVHVLAHSLGTVVAYHGLTGQGLGDGSVSANARIYDAIPRVTGLYTIGSPLEKIRFFWPTTISSAQLSPFTSIDGRAIRLSGAGSSPHTIQWHNFYHRFDAVSGRLKRFEDWGNVRNHALKGGGGMMRSHVIYEQSAEFLGAITEGLFGERAHVPQSRLSRLRDHVFSALENLALPVVLAILLLVGVAFGLVGVLLPGALLAMPFRLAGVYGWVNGIQNTFAVLMLLSVGWTATFGIRDKAKELHGRWSKEK